MEHCVLAHRHAAGWASRRVEEQWGSVGLIVRGSAAPNAHPTHHELARPRQELALLPLLHQEGAYSAALLFPEADVHPALTASRAPGSFAMRAGSSSVLAGWICVAGGGTQTL